MPVDPRARKEERKEKGWDSGDGGDRLPRLEMEVKGFIAAPVGYERFESSGKGTPGLMIRFVVLEEPRGWREEDGDIVGCIVDKDFWLTGNMGDLADLAIAMGWDEPFDEKVDAEVDRMLQNGLGACRITTKADTYVERTRYIPAYFNRCTTYEVAQDGWEELIDAGVADFDKYMEWRAKNPRKKPGEQTASGGQTRGGGAPRSQGARGGGGDGGGGNDARRRGGGGGGGGGGAPPDDAPPYSPDDDIPF